jgi:hypothetical protein
MRRGDYGEFSQGVILHLGAPDDRFAVNFFVIYHTHSHCAR